MLSVLSDCMVLPLSRLTIFRPFAAGGNFVGRHHPGTEAAGTVEILAHAPLRCVALEFAHRPFVRRRNSPAMQSTAFAIVRCLARLPDDRDHFGLIIELDRLLWSDDRLQVRHHRGQHAKEDGGKLRDIVALRTFLDVIEIIQSRDR